MSAAAQREESSLEPIRGEGLVDAPDGITHVPAGLIAAPSHAASAPALRQMAAERVAAHRNRRASLTPSREPVQRTAHAGSPGTGPIARPSVRDAVAARYRQSPSYQEFLAVEAERALQKAQAEAEVAARNALAVAEAQRQLLDEIEHWNQPDPSAQAAAQPIDQPLFIVEPFDARVETQPAALAAPAPAHKTTRPARRSSTPEAQPTIPTPLTVQLYADLPQSQLAPPPAGSARFDSEELEELVELDGEIAFRLAPEFEEHHIETLPIQANIIEFPRQLVATRKARPRLAEGPLREDGTPEPQQAPSRYSTPTSTSHRRPP